MRQKQYNNNRTTIKNIKKTIEKQSNQYKNMKPTEKHKRNISKTLEKQKRNIRKQYNNNNTNNNIIIKNHQKKQKNQFENIVKA